VAKNFFMNARSNKKRSHRVLIADTPAKFLSLRSSSEQRGVLNHIFAGGLRIETRTTREALLGRRRRTYVWRALAALALLWILFQFVRV